MWKCHASFVMQPSRLQHAKCRISITPQLPIVHLITLKPGESKWREASDGGNTAWFQGVVCGWEQHHYHHHHQLLQTFLLPVVSYRIISHLNDSTCKLHLNATFARNNSINKHVSKRLAQAIVQFYGKKISILYQEIRYINQCMYYCDHLVLESCVRACGRWCSWSPKECPALWRHALPEFRWGGRSQTKADDSAPPSLGGVRASVLLFREQSKRPVNFGPCGPAGSFFSGGKPTLSPRSCWSEERRGATRLPGSPQVCPRSVSLFTWLWAFNCHTRWNFLVSSGL